MHISSTVSSPIEVRNRTSLCRVAGSPLALAAALAIGLLGASPGHAEVRSVTKLVTGQDSGLFQEMEVKCVGAASPRIIQQKVERGNWCSKDFPGRCADSTTKLAQAVCTPGFDRDLKELQKSASKAAAEQPVEKTDSRIEPRAESRVALVASSEKERLAIEAKRIRIEQERLDLRKRDLELQNEALDLHQSK